MRLVYSDAALNDLLNITGYIGEQLDNNFAAKKIRAEIVKGCGILKQYPLAGMSVGRRMDKDLGIGLRYLVIGKYLAFYHIVNDSVIIVRVFDSRTDYIRNNIFNDMR